MKKVFFLILVFVCVLSIAGCGQMTDTFKTFSVQGLAQFYDFYATEDTKESLIREGQIEFARIGDLYVCPYIKEVNYDECGLFFYVYALEDGGIETVTVSDVVLSAGNDMVLINGNDDLLITLHPSEESIQLGMSKIEFESTDTWLFNGNTLQLSFRAEIDNGDVDAKEFSYNIEIVGNKSAITIT